MLSLKYLSFMGLQVFGRDRTPAFPPQRRERTRITRRLVVGATLPVMFCPQCRVEYRPGFAHSTDCDVDLVDELPREGTDSFASNSGGSPGDEEDPFCAFWQGDDARLHAELCAVLDEAGIPYKTVRREDHLFNLKNFPAFQMGVPFSLFEKAETAVEHAYQADASDTEARPSPNPAALIADRSRASERLPEPLTPSEEENILQSRRAKTVPRGDMLVASPRENKIRVHRLDLTWQAVAAGFFRTVGKSPGNRKRGCGWRPRGVSKMSRASDAVVARPLCSTRKQARSQA